MNKDSIWWTRKAWINAETKLKFYSTVSNICLFWYSLTGVFASVLLLGENKPEVISKVFVCFSVFVFGVSLLVALGRFTERASHFKKGYIELQALYQKVKSETHLSDDDSRIYKDLLDAHENHTWFDFLNAKVEAYNNTADKSLLTIKATSKDIWLRRILLSLSVVITFLVFIAPIFIIYKSLN